MTHSEASSLCQYLRNANAEETNGTWKCHGTTWEWVPNPECNWQVIQLCNGSFSVELPRDSFVGSLK